jgi:acetyl esterase/lipase
MPSWQARMFSAVIRFLVRRQSWGDEWTLTRRARRLFGAPPIYRSMVAWGIRCRRQRNGIIQGEWLLPEQPSPGVILYVHGGGFVSCSPATHRPITAALARKTGHPVFSLDYRLAPEHRFPAALEDVLTAYQWLVETVAPQPIALAGDSAGGNLVLGAAGVIRDQGRYPSPRCVVGFSPWTDLAGTGSSARTNDGYDPMFHYANIGEFADAYLGAAPASAPAASPVHADMAGLPPVLLHVGSNELLLDDSCRVHQAICSAGGRCELRIFQRVPHCWQLFAPLLPEATTSLAEAASFITLHLSPQTGLPSMARRAQSGTPPRV